LGGEFDTEPSAYDRLHDGDTLIVLGSCVQIIRLERLIRGEEVSEK
jgi:K+/H+ antiporter YhaU regulatory subunit KhtT